MAPDPHRLLAPLLRFLTAPVVAAISGGGDSMALLVLLHEAMAARGSRAHLCAVTVDHGLRSEAAEEARRVAAFCAGHGIAHRTVAWHGPKPSSGMAEAARAARYGLLADAAASLGAEMVVTGHTLDDQAETVRMRLDRGSRADDRGIAGMAPVTLHDDRVWIVRPLLGMRRADLRKLLGERGIGWTEDPSNTDPGYERARVRAALAAAGEAETQALARLSRRAAENRLARAEGVSLLVARHAALVSPGLVRLSPGFFAEADPSALVAWRMLLAMTGGRAHLPEAGAAAALLARAAGESRRATLSRALVDRRRENVFLLREERGLPSPAQAGAGLWDGRFRVVLPPGGAGGVIAPRGRRIGEGERPGPSGAPQDLVDEAFSREPEVRECVVGQPGSAAEAQPRLVPVVAPFATFLSGFDLAAAIALARLAGARPPPAPPWADHIVPPA